MMTRRLALDIAERAALTFVEAFLAVWVVGSWADLSSVGLAQRATVAGVAAAMAAVKGAVASRLGDRSASLVPPPR